MRITRFVCWPFSHCCSLLWDSAENAPKPHESPTSRFRNQPDERCKPPVCTCTKFRIRWQRLRKDLRSRRRQEMRSRRNKSKFRLEAFRPRDVDLKLSHVPKKELQVTIEIPRSTNLYARMRGGDLSVEGVVGDKNLELTGGDLTIQVGSPEDYSHVDLSVRFGDVTGAQFGDPKGWLGNAVRGRVTEDTDFMLMSWRLAIWCSNPLRHSSRSRCDYTHWLGRRSRVRKRFQPFQFGCSVTQRAGAVAAVHRKIGVSGTTTSQMISGSLLRCTM